MNGNVENPELCEKIISELYESAREKGWIK